jgi:hypothetical protein
MYNCVCGEVIYSLHQMGHGPFGSHDGEQKEVE